MVLFVKNAKTLEQAKSVFSEKGLNKLNIENLYKEFEIAREAA